MTMDSQLLSLVYSALFVTALSVGIPLIAGGQRAPGATAIILGVIGLLDASAWMHAKDVRIASFTLRGLDFVGVLGGALAVIGPSVATSSRRSAFKLVLTGSTVYIIACLVFWLGFEQFDQTAFRQVMEAWKLDPTDAKSFVGAFAVALNVLGVLDVAFWLNKLDPQRESAWWIVSGALAVYCGLYYALGSRA
jgi:hypothetical protein